MKYLIETVEVYRVDSEFEATKIIEDAQKDNKYELVKYNRIQREKKQKGEIVDSWYKVTLNKRFTNEKEPEGITQIIYTNGEDCNDEI